MRIFRTPAAAGAACAVLAGAGAASAQGVSVAAPAVSARQPPVAGKLLLETRARYEFVDQAKTGAVQANAEALTLRTRLGWETGEWRRLRGLVEVEDVRHLGPARYAVNVPGAAAPPLNGPAKSVYPLVNDPDVTELNRLQVTWRPNAAFGAVVGRQLIVLDDQRFVGAVAWRQDEQTFDAVRTDVTRGRLKLFYAYVSRVNRVLGEARDWDSDSHLANLAWAPTESLRLQGFVYALDFRNSPANSSLTKGVKVSGKARRGAYQLAYNTTFARQRDYRANTAPFVLDYWGADVAASRGSYTVKGSYETLEGNGTRGFTTPLATSHVFQGWSDAFVQPLGGAKGFVDGLKDANLTLNAKPRWRRGPVSGVDLLVRYHDFDAQRTGAALGHEWDAQASAAITPKLSAALKYADFKRSAHATAGTAAPPLSRTKVWFTLEYRL